MTSATRTEHAVNGAFRLEGRATQETSIKAIERKHDDPAQEACLVCDGGVGDEDGQKRRHVVCCVFAV